MISALIKAFAALRPVMPKGYMEQVLNQSNNHCTNPTSCSVIVPLPNLDASCTVRSSVIGLWVATSSAENHSP